MNSVHHGTRVHPGNDYYQMESELILLVNNHHFKWWFDISPIRADYLLHLKGGYRKHYYHLPLKEALI
ncbi:MAG: hypothetical protein PHT62_12590, partial [Desulfotomaculaceae bacterium]|nr:hypothetical protein [Desulfotomaculaceae bacterium]